MAVRLSALRTGRTLLPRNIYFPAFGTGVPQGLVRPEGLGKLKESTTSELEPATFSSLEHSTPKNHLSE
jgi:hypothetical protein